MIFCRMQMVFAAMVFAFGNAFAGSIDIPPDELRDLKDQRALLVAKVTELDNIGKQIIAAQADRNSAKTTIRRLEAARNKARSDLEAAQKFDRERPGVISPEQMRDYEDKNRQAFSALKEARENITKYEIKINALSNEGSGQYAEFLRLQKSFERDVSRVVDVHVDRKILALQVSKEVQVTERVACGEDSIPVCKERSKKAAELKAIERGSVVFVNSFTEVKNFKLSKEELRSEVQATLTNKVFSNQHFVGDAEYETTITATVVPAISNALREQIAGAIRSEVYSMTGGKIDYSMVQDPAQLASSPQAEEPQESEEAPRRIKSPAKSKITENVPQQEEPAVQEEPPPPQRAPRKLEKPVFTF